MIYRVFACDVMAAMLVYLDKRILNIFFWKYTNRAANFFVVLIPRDWVKTLYKAKIEYIVMINYSRNKKENLFNIYLFVSFLTFVMSYLLLILRN